MAATPDIPPVPSLRTLTYVDPSDFIAYRAQWDARDTAQQATIAYLRAQVAAQHPATLWGASTGTAKAFPAVSTLLAPVGVWRYYLQPGEHLHMPTELPIAPGTALILSSKIKPQDVVTGRYDDDFAALFAALGDSVFCPWHEPEDDVERGNFTVPQYRAMWDHLTPIARQTDVQLAPIVMRATFTGLKGRRWQDYIPDEYDLGGVDAYAAGTIGVGVGDIPDILTPVHEALPGKPVAVCETGVGRKVTGQARTDALTKLAQTFRDDPLVRAVCYFLGNANSNEWALSPADAAAWKAGQK